MRHRKVSKQISPAFSGRALKAKEPTLHKHIDLFIQRMSAMTGEAVNLPTWLNWLFVDISGDVAYNREMNALKDSMLPVLCTCISIFWNLADTDDLILCN